MVSPRTTGACPSSALLCPPVRPSFIPVNRAGHHSNLLCNVSLPDWWGHPPPVSCQYCSAPILCGGLNSHRPPRRGRVRVGVHAGAAAMSSFPPSRPSPARGEGAHAPGDGPPCPIGGDTHRSPSAHRTAVFRLLQAQLPVRPHAAYQRCGPPRPHGSPAADTT
jgi:hypothetical protein